MTNLRGDLKVHRSSEAMLTVIKNLKPWLESDSDHERHHALQMLNNVLASDVVTENIVASVLGSTAGIIATKAMDPDVRCREMALSCTKLLSAIVSGKILPNNAITKNTEFCNIN